MRRRSVVDRRRCSIVNDVHALTTVTFSTKGAKQSFAVALTPVSAIAGFDAAVASRHPGLAAASLTLDTTTEGCDGLPANTLLVQKDELIWCNSYAASPLHARRQLDEAQRYVAALNVPTLKCEPATNGLLITLELTDGKAATSCRGATLESSSLVSESSRTYTTADALDELEREREVCGHRVELDSLEQPTALKVYGADFGTAVKLMVPLVKVP